MNGLPTTASVPKRALDEGRAGRALARAEELTEVDVPAGPLRPGAEIPAPKALVRGLSKLPLKFRSATVDTEAPTVAPRLRCRPSGSGRR